MPSPLSKALSQRWRADFDKHGVAVAAGGHFRAALAVADGIDERRNALASDQNLSEIGRVEKMREHAKGVAPRVAKAARAIAAAKDAVRAQRLALTPTVKDPKNLSAAILRMEIRTMLRGKDAGEALKIAFAQDADPLVIEAIFEAPSILSNIAQEQRDQLLSLVVERTAGPQLAALAEQDEAVELLEAATRGAMIAMRSAVDMQPHQFDNWYTEATPADPKDVAAEAVAFNTEAVTAAAGALPLKSRMGLVESLLATNTAELTKAA